MRSLRRHHNERLKEYRRKRYINSWNEIPPERWVGMWLHTATLCSCCMCGNDRKYQNERTRQEISDIEMMNLDLKELNYASKSH